MYLSLKVLVLIIIFKGVIESLGGEGIKEVGIVFL